jgi:hypothetical protein
MMDPNQAKEVSERDQLWASLRALQPEIDRLARGEFNGDERDRQFVLLLARIVAAELSFRDRESSLGPPPDERE